MLTDTPPAEPEAPAVAPESAPFARVVTTMGRVLTLEGDTDGSVTLRVGERLNPMTLDRWQARAMADALAALALMGEGR